MFAFGNKRMSLNYPLNSTFSGALSVYVPFGQGLLISLTLLHSELPKLHRVLAVLSAVELSSKASSLSI